MDLVKFLFIVRIIVLDMYFFFVDELKKWVVV